MLARVTAARAVYPSTYPICSKDYYRWWRWVIWPTLRVSFRRVWRVSLSVCLSAYGLIKWILFNTFDLSHSTYNSWTWNRIVISSHYILSRLSLTISSDDESEARRKWKATRDWHVKWPPCKLPDNDRVLFTLYSRLTTHLTLFAFNHHPRERTRHLSIQPFGHSSTNHPLRVRWWETKI